MEVKQSLTEIIARLDNFAAGMEDLCKRVEALEQASKATNKSEREMTDEDAYKILTGELASLKHNDAAKKLNLSYGQVYSCRLEYTFRHIHKKLAEQGFKNPWKTKS